MKGGFFDTLSNWGSSLWQKTKNATSSATSSLTGSQPSYQNYAQQPASQNYTQQPASQNYGQPMSTSTYGGRRNRKHTRRMRGGFKDNTPTTGLAAHAASFSGVTAKPHTLVGGKTRKNRKSRKNRRH
jgi:hypothetical protein